jgi:hypothetical protein
LNAAELLGKTERSAAFLFSRRSKSLVVHDLYIRASEPAGIPGRTRRSATFATSGFAPLCPKRDSREEFDAFPRVVTAAGSIGRAEAAAPRPSEDCSGPPACRRSVAKNPRGEERHFRASRNPRSSSEVCPAG